MFLPHGKPGHLYRPGAAEAVRAICFSRRISDCETLIFLLFRGNSIINSTRQLGELLFELRDFPREKDETGYSTNAGSSGKAENKHFIIPAATAGPPDADQAEIHLRRRAFDEGDPGGWAIHTTFQNLVTATGRCPLRNPISRISQSARIWAREIRKCSFSKPG